MAAPTTTAVMRAAMTSLETVAIACKEHIVHELQSTIYTVGADSVVATESITSCAKWV